MDDIPICGGHGTDPAWTLCVSSRRTSSLRGAAVAYVGIMTPGGEETVRVLEHIRATMGEQPGNWPAWGGGYPNEIEAAIIDAVFSANARYGKTRERGVRK